MKDETKTKKQLLNELKDLRLRIPELESSEIKHKKIAEALRESEERLKTVMESVNDVIFQLSPSGIIKYVNPKVEEIYGYRAGELIGKHFKKTTPVREVPKAIKALKSASSGKIIKNFEINQKNSKGKITPMEINITPVRKNGRIVAVQGVMRDISERKKAEKELMESEAKNRSLLIAIPDLIFRLTNDGVFLEHIPAKKFPLWMPPSEFIGKNVNEVLDKKTAEQFMRCLKRAVKTGEIQVFQYQLFFNKKIHHYEARFVANRKEEVLAIVRDFTKQRQVEKMAETDPLTNVYNRRKFSELLEQDIDRVGRYNRSLSIVMLDIDHFKKINDVHGHDAGDYVLKRMTRFIEENIRRVDILARYGGEEFVIILPETNLKGALVLTERIRRIIESASFGKAGRLTISAGIAEFMEGDTRKSMVKRADMALYMAKREGRNRIRVL